MKIKSVLEQFQDIIEDSLLQLDELRNIPILNYQQSDIMSVIESNTKSGIGTAILIMPPVPIEIDQNVAGPVFDRMSLEIDVIENCAPAPIGKTLLFVVETIMRTLHMRDLSINNDTCILRLAPGSSGCRLERNDNITHFHMTFETACHLSCL